MCLCLCHLHRFKVLRNLIQGTPGSLRAVLPMHCVEQQHVFVCTWCTGRHGPFSLRTSHTNACSTHHNTVLRLQRRSGCWLFGVPGRCDTWNLLIALFCAFASIDLMLVVTITLYGREKMESTEAKRRCFFHLLLLFCNQVELAVFRIHRCPVYICLGCWWMLHRTVSFHVGGVR